MFLSLFYAGVAHAASADQIIGNFKTKILNPIASIFFALALLYFLFGVYEFASAGNDESAVTTGKQHMLWGLVGLVIMFGVFGIMRFICNVIGCEG